MIKKAKELNKAIKESSYYKEYSLLKETISKEESIQTLLNKIKKTQDIANKQLKANKIEEYNKTKKELAILKEEFETNPLIANYLVSKNELYSLLEQVVTILSDN